MKKFGKVLMVVGVAALGLAFAQTANPNATLIAATDVASTQNAWIAAAAVGVPGLLGIFGIRAAADFIMNRLKKVAR